MQYFDLIKVCDEYLLAARCAISQEWSRLATMCPSLLRYDSYEDFEDDFTLEDLDGRESTLYREMGKTLTESNLLLQMFLIQLFSKKLRQIIRIIRNRYDYREITEEIWSIIIDIFIEYLISVKPNLPNTEEVIKKTRNTTGTRIRRWANENKSKTMHRVLSRVNRNQENPAMLAMYNEIMDSLESKLSDIEYAALCLRMKHEFYDRKKDKEKIKVSRDKAAERRAVRKSRKHLIRLLKLSIKFPIESSVDNSKKLELTA